MGGSDKVRAVEASITGRPGFAGAKLVGILFQPKFRTYVVCNGRPVAMIQWAVTVCVGECGGLVGRSDGTDYGGWWLNSDRAVGVDGYQGADGAAVDRFRGGNFSGAPVPR